MIKQYCLVLTLFQQVLQLVETVIAECKSTRLDSYRLTVLFMFCLEEENAFVAAAEVLSTDYRL